MITPFLALVLSTSAPVAQDFKLNEPLALGLTGEFGQPVVSPDGRILVYVADQEGDKSHELYSTPIAGGAPRRLSGWVDRYRAGAQVSTDSKRVLFLADLDGDWLDDLAVVLIDGSAPPRALDATATGGSVRAFQVSPDGVHAVYHADQDEPERFELYSVRIDGTAPPVRLNGTLVAGGDVVESAQSGAIVLSRDGALALYGADQETDGLVELFVVPVDGSTSARKLPLPLVAGGDVTAFEFDATAARVVYTADQEEDERYELFSIATDGSQPPRKLNAALAPGGDLGWHGQLGPEQGFPHGGGFMLSPDGLRVVYGADQEEDGRSELYSVPVEASSAPVKLNLPSDERIYLSSVSPDSGWVIYSSGPAGMAGRELSSAPIDGSAPARRLNGPLMTGGSVSWSLCTRDSSSVVYTADQDTDQVIELYGVPIDGSAPAVKLNAPLPPGGRLNGDVNFPGFFPVEGGVVYEADQEVRGRIEIYFVPAAGGVAPRRVVSGPAFLHYPPASSATRILFQDGNGGLNSIDLAPGSKSVAHDSLVPRVVGDVGAFDLDASGERVVYQAQEERDAGVPQIDSVRTRERLERVELGIPGASSLPSARLIPDGSRVVFTARFGTTGPRHELYSARTDGVTAPVRLDPPAGTVQAFWLTPDGAGVVFESRFAGESALYSAPVDASAPAVLLAAALSGPLETRISADGSRVAFRDAARLFTAPVDGSTPAVLASGALTAVMADFHLAGPDGHAVVFRAGARRSELFVAPSDGSVPPRKLDATASGLSNVVKFVLAPDGGRAAYLADQVDEVFELFGVPLDGGAPSVRLHPALSGHQDVFDVQVSSDGLHAVYHADPFSDEVRELFSVPLDAGRAPVRLNRALVAGGDVLSFAITPDGKRVLFTADQETDQAVGLYSTPIRGSRGPRRLSAPHATGGSVGSFQISADSSTVAYLAVRNGEGARLLTVDAAGREAATLLAGPFQGGGGGMVTYRLSADGSVLVYSADREELNVFELYAVRRQPGAARVPRRR